MLILRLNEINKTLNTGVLMKTFTPLCAALLSLATSACAASPHMATGIKIGEVTDTEAIVWVRLTKDETRVDYGAPMPEVSYTLLSTGEPIVDMKYRQADAVPAVSFPDGSSIDTLEGATPGAGGFVRVHYKTGDENDAKVTAWKAVDPAADFTQQFQLADLQPGSQYAIEVEYGARKNQDSQTLTGTFRTAPAGDVEASVTFTVVTGQRYPDRDSDDGFKIYGQMQSMDPDFFVHTGDILYYDQFAKTAALANWHWQRVYSLKSLTEFHRSVASYFMKDDHDTLVNDSWPSMQTTFMGDLTFEKGQSFDVLARFEDESQLFDPKVIYRTRSDSHWKHAAFTKSAGTEDFRANIKARELRGPLEYFIEVFDEYGNGPARMGSPDAPILVSTGIRSGRCCRRFWNSAHRVQPPARGTGRSVGCARAPWHRASAGIA